MSVAVVTGGSSGIGAACVASLARHGVKVAVVDRAATQRADLSIAVDVRDQQGPHDAVATAETTLGPVEYLVTAAGYYSANSFRALDPGAWQEMIEVHVGGTAGAWRAVLPGMRARGRGGICAIGSELGLIGDPAAPHYAAAKGAIHTMVKSVSVELARVGIRVNCVAPGPTDTPLLNDDPNTAGYVSSLPLGRLITPDEIAAAVSFVLLEETNLLGQVISPNGGAAP